MKSPPRNPTHQELSNSTRFCCNFLIYIWFCWLVLEICSIFNNSWTAKCKHHQTTTSVHLYSLKASQWYKGTTKSNMRFGKSQPDKKTIQSKRINYFPQTKQWEQINYLPSIFYLILERWLTSKVQSKFSNAFNIVLHCLGGGYY